MKLTNIAPYKQLLCDRLIVDPDIFSENGSKKMPYLSGTDDEIIFVNCNQESILDIIANLAIGVYSDIAISSIAKKNGLETSETKSRILGRFTYTFKTEIIAFKNEIKLQLRLNFSKAESLNFSSFMRFNVALLEKDIEELLTKDFYRFNCAFKMEKNDENKRKDDNFSNEGVLEFLNTLQEYQMDDFISEGFDISVKNNSYIVADIAGFEYENKNLPSEIYEIYKNLSNNELMRVIAFIVIYQPKIVTIDDSAKKLLDFLFILKEKYPDYFKDTIISRKKK